MSARPPDLCPVCGDAVPARAAACPTCGACERSGWRASADLPVDEFDYEWFVADEFGAGGRVRRPAREWFWWAASVLVLIALALLWVRPYL